MAPRGRAAPDRALGRGVAGALMVDLDPPALKDAVDESLVDEIIAGK